jgi:MFS family permease
MLGSDLAGSYVRWSFSRAACSRGWWLATSLYLVVVAELTPFQLIFVGVAQSLLAVAAEVPAGVLADTVSRKWSIVAAHGLSGAGMIATGFVTGFPELVATQMLWGLGWTFSSGADVAWLTDELDDESRIARVLTASARWGEVGGFAGTIGFGVLAWVAGLETAIVAAGASMVVLGCLVGIEFPERRFARAKRDRWRASMTIFRRGANLARRDRQILVILLATVLINGVAETGRLYPRHLVDLGLPGTAEPIAWLTGLGLATLAMGAIALRVVEARIDGDGVARRVYALACVIGAGALVLVAQAPDSVTAMAGIVLVSGIAMSVTRTVGVIWVNRRVTSDVRATVQSFLAQAEYSGEIVIGFGLALAATGGSVVTAIMASAAILALAALLVFRAAEGRAARALPVEG